MDTPVFSSDGKFVKMYENYVKIAILFILTSCIFDLCIVSYNPVFDSYRRKK